jgi:phosphonate transport system substrate-binding protein
MLWTSDPIVESPICMRPEVNPAFTEKVRQAYLDMPKKMRLRWLSRLYGHVFSQAGRQHVYMRVDDSLYDRLRKIAGSHRRLNTD